MEVVVFDSLLWFSKALYSLVDIHQAKWVEGFEHTEINHQSRPYRQGSKLGRPRRVDRKWYSFANVDPRGAK
jgi:hypothetical protein